MPPGTPTSSVPTFPATVPFDPSAHLGFLETIQGNILRSHGRKHTRLVFFRFHEEKPANRSLLAAAIRANLVTSAAEQYRQTNSGSRDLPFYGLALTHRFFATAQYAPTPAVDAIVEGTRRELRRPTEPGDRWELPYVERPDGLWLLAHEQQSRLARMQLEVETLLAAHGAASYAAEENGFLWSDRERDASGRKIYREPFGFRDGISSSLFLAARDPGLSENEQKHIQIPLEQVLIPPPPPGTESALAELAGGSFMTLAKLEQDVAGFLAFEEAMAAAAVAQGHRVPPDAGTLLVGRDRSGEPFGVPPGARLNDFEYAGGRANTGCPFHAHIRKSNPRAGDTNHPGDPSGKSAQFVRRSVVYDKFNQLPCHSAARYHEQATLKGHLGLLFMGYMADVGGQFETLFNNWYRDPGFPYSATGLKDVLLGGGTADNETWKWNGFCVPGLPRFVRNRGVLHFFVPSLPWLARQTPPAE